MSYKNKELEKPIKADILYAAASAWSKSDIVLLITEKYPFIDHHNLENLIEDITSTMPTYHLKQKIKRCKIVQDISGDDMCYMLDPASKDIMRIKETKITRLCATKEERRSILKAIYPAQFTYNPFEATRLYRNNLDWFYNSYMPPTWYEEVFYSNGNNTINKRNLIPPLYQEFFNHLVKNHKSSYDYVLKWLANSIKDRNYCVLTAIGNQGIGKGVLGEIMRFLVGEKNFHTSDTRLITKDFNKQFKNKRIVFCDEIQILKIEHVNKFKALINDMIEIEGKGENAVEVKNYASIYIASNNFDSIRLTDDDRRFSIIELTDEKLIKKMSTSQINQLIEPKNIQQLAEFLWYLPVDEDEMKTPFRSSRTEEVRLAGLKDWEEWLFDDYAVDHAGEDIKLSIVSEAVEEEFGSKFKPSRRALKKLQAVYPKKYDLTYKVLANKKRAWYVKFPEVKIEE